MSATRSDREFARERVLKTLHELLAAAYSRDQTRLAELSTSSLRKDLVSGSNDLFEVLDRLGELHLMPVPTVTVDGRDALALFPVQGPDFGAFQMMYAALVRTDDLPAIATSRAEIEGHRWAVTTVGAVRTAPAETDVDRHKPSRQVTETQRIDWDDPSFVIEEPDERTGRRGCSVADILKEAEDYTDEGLALVGRAGGTRLAEYVREHRPELLLKHPASSERRGTGTFP